LAPTRGGGGGGDGEGEGGEEGGRGLENKRKRSPGKMDTEEEDERKKRGNVVGWEGMGLKWTGKGETRKVSVRSVSMYVGGGADS